jgi:ABC-type uncharacterized transport system permease subunit
VYLLKSATALTTATGRGIGKADIDGIGRLDIGLGGIIIASGFTGITVIVKES